MRNPGTSMVPQLPNTHPLHSSSFVSSLVTENSRAPISAIVANWADTAQVVWRSYLTPTTGLACPLIPRSLLGGGMFLMSTSGLNFSPLQYIHSQICQYLHCQSIKFAHFKYPTIQPNSFWLRICTSALSLQYKVNNLKFCPLDGFSSAPFHKWIGDITP